MARGDFVSGRVERSKASRIEGNRQLNAKETATRFSFVNRQSDGLIPDFSPLQFNRIENPRHCTACNVDMLIEQQIISQLKFPGPETIKTLEYQHLGV